MGTQRAIAVVTENPELSLRKSFPSQVVVKSKTRQAILRPILPISTIKVVNSEKLFLLFPATGAFTVISSKGLSLQGIVATSPTGALPSYAACTRRRRFISGFPTGDAPSFFPLFVHPPSVSASTFLPTRRAHHLIRNNRTASTSTTYPRIQPLRSQCFSTLWCLHTPSLQGRGA
jgi:hypothetical protein